MSQPLKAEYRRLGKSGLKVSVPIVGLMSIGDKRWQQWVIEEDEALPLLKAAWDRGLNTWDTANGYSNGESERLVAKALKTYSIPRHKILILTKCYFAVGEAPDVFTIGRPDLLNSRDYVNQYGLSRAAIFNQVEASLKRLETDYIDVLQIHRFDPNTPAEETMEALHDLVRSGKVRYIGASAMLTWQFAHYNHVAEKHGWTQFISMQNQHSLMYREEEREMLKYCAFKGIGVIPYSPLAGGVLARPLGQDTVRSEAAKSRGFDRKVRSSDEIIIKRTEELAKKKGWTMAQVGLAWSTSKVTSPIVGFSSIQRMEESIIPDKKLEVDEEKYLEEPYEPQGILIFG